MAKDGSFKPFSEVGPTGARTTRADRMRGDPSSEFGNRIDERLIVGFVRAVGDEQGFPPRLGLKFGRGDIGQPMLNWPRALDLFPREALATLVAG